MSKKNGLETHYWNSFFGPWIMDFIMQPTSKSTHPFAGLQERAHATMPGWSFPDPLRDWAGHRHLSNDKTISFILNFLTRKK